jgi:predicted PurR-regulated permease PerM
MRWQHLDATTKVILKVILAVLLLAFLWVIRDILIVLLLAIILASAMEPMVAYFHARRVPRAVSVLTVYILVIAAVVLVASLVVPLVISQLNVLAANLPQYTQQLQGEFPILQSVLGTADLSTVIRHGLSVAGGSDSVLTRTVGLFNGFFSVITVLVISFYLVAEQKGMIEFIRSLVPPQHQAFATNLVGKIQRRMGRWVIGQLILSCVIFFFTFIGLTLLGVKYALFLALIAGLLEMLPYIGPFIAAVPAIFFALLQSPALALAVAALYLLVQKTEGYLLVPKIMERTVGTSPLLVLIALLVGLKLAGILGLLISVPLVGAITMVVTELSANQAAALAMRNQSSAEPPAP